MRSIQHKRNSSQRTRHISIDTLALLEHMTDNNMGLNNANSNLSMAQHCVAGMKMVSPTGPIAEIDSAVSHSPSVRCRMAMPYANVRSERPSNCRTNSCAARCRARAVPCAWTPATTRLAKSRCEFCGLSHASICGVPVQFGNARPPRTLR